MLEQIPINFDPTTLVILNFILAFLMFGVSLNLKPSDFTNVLKAPLVPCIGLFCQFVLLPGATYLLIILFDISAGLALGMLLVSSCPGGNFSNIMTFLSRGNVATSVTMTAISSAAAVVMTPLNFSFYAWLNPSTRALFISIELNAFDILGLVILVLGVPLVVGMLVGQHFPKLAKTATVPMRRLSLLIFASFVAMAFASNFNLFTQYWSYFFWLVVLHNTTALALGYASATLFKLKETDRRALTFEVGIQNSGLGLVLLFTFMPNLGGAMLITAFWGAWHLISGTMLALFWAQRKPRSECLV